MAASSSDMQSSEGIACQAFYEKIIVELRKKKKYKIVIISYNIVRKLPAHFCI